MSSVDTDAPSAVSSALGDLEIELQVFLRGPDGSLSELTGGQQSMTLPISGGSFEELASRTIGEGVYEEVRIVFHSVEADVTGGLEIDGIPIIDRIRVQNTAPIVVERELGLLVDEQRALEILIDLNAGAWLPLASTIDLTDLTVSVEAFVGALEVTSRSVGG